MQCMAHQRSKAVVQDKKKRKVKSDWAPIQGVFVCMCVRKKCVVRREKWLITRVKAWFLCFIFLPCKQLSIIRWCHVSTMMLIGWVNAQQRGREGGAGVGHPICPQLRKLSCLRPSLCNRRQTQHCLFKHLNQAELSHLPARTSYLILNLGHD